MKVVDRNFKKIDGMNFAIRCWRWPRRFLNMQLVVENSHDSDLERKGLKDEDEKNSIMSYFNHHIPSIYHFIVWLGQNHLSPCLSCNRFLICNVFFVQFSQSYNYLSTLYRTTLCTCLSYNSLPVFHALSCLCSTSLSFCMSCHELSVFYVLCTVCLPALWWYIRHNKHSFIYEYHTIS